MAIKNGRTLRKRIYELAYPFYDCGYCVGQEEWHGCYCASVGAYSVGGDDPPWWVKLLRKFVKRK